MTLWYRISFSLMALLLVLVFTFAGISLATDQKCIEAGYPGGFALFNLHRYCNKREISIYSSPYIPLEQVTK